MSTPQSKICVCSGVPIHNDYKITLWFDNKSKQDEYFAGKVVNTFSAYTYLRKNWSLDVQATYEQAETWNYLYFTNFNTGKTYYYFITKINYISDSMVRIDIEMDVMQTYFFDYELKPCFIDREHTRRDAIGINRYVDEGLEIGELINTSNDDINIEELCILVMMNFNPQARDQDGKMIYDRVLASRYDGIFGGMGIWAVDMVNWNALGTCLLEFDKDGQSDGIISIWMYPKSLVRLKSGQEWGATVFQDVEGTKPLQRTFSRPSKLGGYEPNNKKLLSYPYCFLYVSNNNGGGAVYQYDEFGSPESPTFNVVGALSPEGSVKLYPGTYKGREGYDYGLMGGNYPTCAWNQDVYKLWLAQNQNQQNISMAMDGLKIVGGAIGVVTGNPIAGVGGAGAIISGVEGIANTLAQRQDKSIQPPQAKGHHSASVNVTAGHHTFTVFNRCLTVENARIIDQYFSMYGYKTNEVKVPNRKVREYWTYTKTIGCLITGNLCNEDVQKIQSIYDNGITFWRTDTDRAVGDYGVVNRCISEVE